MAGCADHRLGARSPESRGPSRRTSSRTSRAPVVALVGPPNVGKSTLFSALTGLHRTTGNWPGTTVEVSGGELRDAERRVEVLDLPGTLSLEPTSPDEALTAELVTAADDAPDLVVAVVAAPTLARDLYLLSELRETRLRLVVVVTKLDVARRRGMTLDLERLEALAGAPVLALNPRRGGDHQALGAVVQAGLAQPAPRALDAGAEGALGALERVDRHFAWVAEVYQACVVEPRSRPSSASVTSRIDRWVLAPVLGPLIFLGVMWLVFQATTRLAAPLQQALAGLVAGPVSAAAASALALVGLGGTWVEGLVVEGVIAGVGMLLTFVPLLLLMFALISVLEDSGYLARAAVVTDRFMRLAGLPGRAFLPFVVGYGCNVPAVTATRILPQARDRLLVVLLVPFTLCSARLTVFVLISAAFFGDQAGNVVFGMYLASVVLLVAVGRLLRATLIGRFGIEPLVIDLPDYHLPSARVITASAWMRLRAFLRSAGTIIVLTVAAIWVLMAIPLGGGAWGDPAPEDSALAVTSAAVAPVFAPAGFGDWRAVSALATGMVAKEAVISTWSQVSGAGPSEASLQQQVRADFDRSSHGAPAAAALAFMVFVLAYTPCVATLTAQAREVGWRWAAAGTAIQLTTAWVLAVLVFQAGRAVIGP